MRCYGRKEDRLRSLKRCLLDTAKKRDMGKQQADNRAETKGREWYLS